MLLGGINFSLHYQAFTGNFKKVLINTEFQTFIGISVLASISMVYLLMGTGMVIGESLREGVFQAVAMSTGTGYAVANYDNWPELARMILLFLMFIGASAGSTGGGMKVLRILLVFKMVIRSFKQFISPRRVIVVRLGDRVIDEDTLRNISMFFLAYMILFAVSSLLLVAIGLDLVTGISGAVSALSNVGPALGGLGPNFNARAVPPIGRFLLSILMWIGRLEIFTAVVLFSPELYKRKRLGNLLRLKK